MRLARAYPISSFFLLAYALSWSYWLVVMGLLGHTSTMAFWTGAFGPALAGLLVSGALEGRAGVRGYLRRIVVWRVKVRWYVAALLGPPAIILAGVLAEILATSPPSTGDRGAVAVTPWFFPLLLSNVVVMVVWGPGLGEEPGWRGFALPRLQQRAGPVRGTVVLGLLWAGWHLPLFVLAGFSGGLSSFPWYAAYSVAWSLLLTWLFNHARESVLLVALAHVSMDESQAWMEYLKPAQVSTDGAYFMVLLVAVVLTLVTRGRLGYRANTSDPVRRPSGRVSGPPRASSGAGGRA